MLLKLTSTDSSARDLGFLLHKHPDRLHSFNLNFGKAHVFYPEASDERCTVALAIDVDPVGLVRKDGWRDASLAQYVNDRPYVASSFLSVAIAQVFGTALSGNCKQRPELLDRLIPAEISITNLPCRGGLNTVRRLFEPLGYEVEGELIPLDGNFPDWGDSIYAQVILKTQKTVREILANLYVLIPVLDSNKHYWVGDDEVAKLLKHGEGWLADHPERKFITQRYLKRRASLIRQALERLEELQTDEDEATEEDQEEVIERPMSLHDIRLDRMVEVLRDIGAQSVCDAGCGEGKLLSRLLKQYQIKRILGIEVSWKALEIAHKRLRVDQMSERQRARVQLEQGSLTYRDKRMKGYDAITLVEVIEHLDLDRLPALERVVFGEAQPNFVIVSTPNIEYNVRFENLSSGKLRHQDHRFEWNREEFSHWCSRVCEAYGYSVDIQPIGDVDPEVGPPSQMGVFKHG